MKKLKSHDLTTIRFSGTLDDIIENLKSEFEYYSKNYSNLRVERDYNYDDSSYCRHTLYGDKLETDKEETIRETQEKEYLKRQEEYQRKQYEELKAKFEKQ